MIEEIISDIPRQQVGECKLKNQIFPGDALARFTFYNFNKTTKENVTKIHPIVLCKNHVIKLYDFIKQNKYILNPYLIAEIILSIKNKSINRREL